MRCLFNYKLRSRQIKNDRQVSRRCWAVTKQLFEMGYVMPVIVLCLSRAYLYARHTKADRQKLSQLNNSFLRTDYADYPQEFARAARKSLTIHYDYVEIN